MNFEKNSNNNKIKEEKYSKLTNEIEAGERHLEDNFLEKLLDSIFRKQYRYIFLISLLFTSFSFIFLYIKQKGLYKDNWFFHNKIVTLIWFICLYYILIDRIKLTDNPQNIEIKENEEVLKKHNKFEINFFNFYNKIIWSRKTYKLLALIVITIFVQYLMKYRGIHGNAIINIIFSTIGITIPWFVTFFFVIYLSLIPDTNLQVNFLKGRNNHAILTYLTALLGFYGLPLPVYWITMIFPTYNLKMVT